MPQNKSIVKFIPAGLKITNRDVTCSPVSSATEPVRQKTENVLQKVTDSCNISKILTPPKTICKNKSLTQPNYATKIINAGAFHTDLQEEDLTLITNGHCKTETTKTSKSNFFKNTDSNLNEVSYETINAANNCKSVPEKPQVSIDNGKLESEETLNNTTHRNNRTNLRAILYKQAKLKRNNELKEAKDSRTQENKYLNSVCQCNNVKCDNFVNCSKWTQQNLHFEKTEHSRTSVPFFTDSTEKRQYLTKKMNHKIILQGPLIPKIVSSLNETFLEENIQMSLQTLNYSIPNTIQSYMWLGIQRGLNAVIVAPPKSGKTLSYLPAFCSFCTEKNGKYEELSIYEGPLVIILSHNSENCDHLKNLTKTLSQSTDICVESLTDEFCNQLKKCDILITTPPLLVHYLKLGVVKIHRLCHIAIENAYYLLRNYHQNMENILTIVNILQTNRPHNKNIQLVVTSEKWSLDLDCLVKKLYTAPLICFTDFLEAAVYSKTHFTKKKLKSLHKIFYLDDILKIKYMTHKSVVFCKQEEIAKIKEHLELNGIECIAISDYLEEDDIFENENMWNCLQCGHYKVLLCTDSIFDKTYKIMGADWLVHYCIPDDESQFQERFRCLGNNFHSPLVNEEGNSNQSQSFIIFDETHENPLLKKIFDTLTRNSISYLQI